VDLARAQKFCSEMDKRMKQMEDELDKYKKTEQEASGEKDSEAVETPHSKKSISS
jgi:hypothetical protein